MVNEIEATCCRLCKSTDLTVVVDLGMQVITSRFPKKGEEPAPPSRITLVQCGSCALVQLKWSADSSELYEHFYGYRSGVNTTMRNHLVSYNKELQSYAELSEGKAVLDIGSNDCTFLSQYPSHVLRVGCDPTGRQFEEEYKKFNCEIIMNYFTKENVRDRYGPDIRFQLVSSVAMFYDLPDPVQFARDIHDVLAEDGVWTLEQSYVLLMLERKSIDTICHEHTEYYGVKQIKDIMDRAGLKIIGLSLNEANGGSFRTFVCKKTCSRFPEATELVEKYLKREEEERIHTPERYFEWVRECDEEVKKLNFFLDSAKKDGKSVYIYGASTKGNCLLQYANIGPEKIPFAVERNPKKEGLMTSTGIEIIMEEKMRKDPPDFLLVLPWHFRDEIVKREDDFLQGGGQLVFPFPSFEIFANRPKAMVTGIDGQIGSYVGEALRKDCAVYGIVSEVKRSERGVFRMKVDIADAEALRLAVLAVQPDKVAHMASISSTEACERDVARTLAVNGMAATIICQTVDSHNLPTRVVNASSSELWKGHVNYKVTAGDKNFRPSTVYGIAKLAGHQMVDFLRETKGRPFSNAVLFTTESRRRSGQFILRKAALHARRWAEGGGGAGSVPALQVGSLNTFRNIIHASDVASAVSIMLDQKEGGTHIVCGSSLASVEQLVVDIYGVCGIQLQKETAAGEGGGGTVTFREKATGREVIRSAGVFRQSESAAPAGGGSGKAVGQIDGDNSSLRALGWSPRVPVQGILADLAEMQAPTDAPP